MTVLGGAACSGRGPPRDAGTLSFDRVGLLLPCECWHPRIVLPAGARTHARTHVRAHTATSTSCVQVNAKHLSSCAP